MHTEAHHPIIVVVSVLSPLLKVLLPPPKALATQKQPTYSIRHIPLLSSMSITLQKAKQHENSRLTL